MERRSMNATTLYVSTSRVILKSNPEDPSTFSDLYRLFPLLRESLSCSVCGNLLVEPYTPTESHCQHHVCKSCKGGKKNLGSTCSWCRDYSKYVPNTELRTLLQCYKMFCAYVNGSKLFRTLCAMPSTSKCVGQHEELMEILNEGASLKDTYKPRQSTSNLTSKSNTKRKTNGQARNARASRGRGNAIVNGETTYSVTSTNNGNRLTFKRTAKELNGDVEKAEKINKVRKRSVFIKPPICKCGQSGSAKGTCRGYRCPCYSDDKPCSPVCNCVACKNPRGSPPPQDEMDIKDDVLDDDSSEVTT